MNRGSTVAFYIMCMMLISAQEKPKTWAALAASRAPAAPTNTAPTTNSRPTRQPQPVRFKTGDVMCTVLILKG